MDNCDLLSSAHGNHCLTIISDSLPHLIIPKDPSSSLLKWKNGSLLFSATIRTLNRLWGFESAMRTSRNFLDLDQIQMEPIKTIGISQSLIFMNQSGIKKNVMKIAWSAVPQCGRRCQEGEGSTVRAGTAVWLDKSTQTYTICKLSAKAFDMARSLVFLCAIILSSFVAPTCELFTVIYSLIHYMDVVGASLRQWSRS